MTWTHRERVLAALSHEETDRVPIDFGGAYATTIYFTAYERLKKHLDVEAETVIATKKGRTALVDETILRRFDVDVRGLRLGAYEGGANQEDIDEDNYRDEWGVVWTKTGTHPYITTDGPFYNKVPVIEDLESHSWPDPDNPGLYRGLSERAEALRRDTDCAIVLNLRLGIVHEGQFLRGYADWLKDLYKRPEFANRLMEFTGGYCRKVVENALEAVGDNVDIVWFGDDMAIQESTLFDPKIYRQLIRPHQERTISMVKALADVKVVFHSCGAIAPLLDDLIGIGVDAINPVQVGAKGMDPARLKKEFGDRLAFWGGIDTQRILPFGTPDDVRAETRRIIDILGKGGGYVLNSVHNIQPEVSPENIIAMFDEARSYRPGRR